MQNGDWDWGTAHHHLNGWHYRRYAPIGARRNQVNLAISLHAPNDVIRSRNIPSNKKQVLITLLPQPRNILKLPEGISVLNIS